MQGYITGKVNITNCGNDTDLIVKLFDYNTNEYIGFTTISETGVHIFDDIDTDKKYTVILEDKNRIIEQQVSSYRSPNSLIYDLTVEFKND